MNTLELENIIKAKQSQKETFGAKCYKQSLLKNYAGLAVVTVALAYFLLTKFLTPKPTYVGDGTWTPVYNLASETFHATTITLIIINLLLLTGFFLMHIYYLKQVKYESFMLAEWFFPAKFLNVSTYNYIMRKVYVSYVENDFNSPEHKQAYLEAAAKVLTELEAQKIVKDEQVEQYFDSNNYMLSKNYL